MDRQQLLTDPASEKRGCSWTVRLECFIEIVRALRMGSCFSFEGRTSIPSSPTSPTGGSQKRKASLKKRLDISYWTEEPLHKVPGRFYLNGSTEFASLFTMQGRKGTNQDAMIVWEVGILIFQFVTVLVVLVGRLLPCDVSAVIGFLFSPSCV